MCQLAEAVDRRRLPFAKRRDVLTRNGAQASRGPNGLIQQESQVHMNSLNTTLEVISYISNNFNLKMWTIHD